MGEPAYAVLKLHCDNRIEAIAVARKEMKKRELPLFIIHPATLAAGK
jgi:protein-tyrosine phosphatase